MFARLYVLARGDSLEAEQEVGLGGAARVQDVGDGGPGRGAVVCTACSGVFWAVLASPTLALSVIFRPLAWWFTADKLPCAMKFHCVHCGQ